MLMGGSCLVLMQYRMDQTQTLDCKVVCAQHVDLTTITYCSVV